MQPPFTQRRRQYFRCYYFKRKQKRRKAERIIRLPLIFPAGNIWSSVSFAKRSLSENNRRSLRMRRRQSSGFLERSGPIRKRSNQANHSIFRARSPSDDFQPGFPIARDRMRLRGTNEDGAREFHRFNAKGSGEIHRITLEIFQGAISKRAFMRRPQNDTRHFACLEGFLPARRAKAPAISRLHSGEAILRQGRGKIIATRLGKSEELFRRHDTNRMAAYILGGSVTAAIAEKPRQRIEGTALQRLSQHIARRPAAPISRIISEHEGSKPKGSGERCVRLTLRKAGENQVETACAPDPCFPLVHATAKPSSPARMKTHSPAACHWRLPHNQTAIFPRRGFTSTTSNVHECDLSRDIDSGNNSAAPPAVTTA